MVQWDIFFLWTTKKQKKPLFSMERDHCRYFFAKKLSSFLIDMLNFYWLNHDFKFQGGDKNPGFSPPLNVLRTFFVYKIWSKYLKYGFSIIFVVPEKKIVSIDMMYTHRHTPEKNSTPFFSENSKIWVTQNDKLICTQILIYDFEQFNMSFLYVFRF